MESITGQKAEFKSVFQRVSKILDRVACQKCKLHAKLSMLGIGTALKVLLLPKNLIAGSLNRSEVVALFNTLAKFSHAIHTIEHLAALHWAGSGSGSWLWSWSWSRSWSLSGPWPWWPWWWSNLCVTCLFAV